jgi:hypothetical protein
MEELSMAIPNSRLLGDPKFVQSMIDALKDADPTFLSVRDLLPRPPKFRKAREVHAQRARKLRKRGEYVHFVRWENGHCVYSWSGKVPDTFTFRMHPATQASGEGKQ